MSYSASDWAIKRSSGLVRFLLVDGILYTGGPFAVVLQVVGYFLFGGDRSFGQYFADATTWITFFFHGTLFGLIMGYIKWRRYERAYGEMGNTPTDLG